MTVRFDGLIPATVLPMTANANPDESALRAYLEWVVGQGVIGIAINVDTGESAHLTQTEKVRILEVARDAVPSNLMLVAGVSGPSTEQAVRQAKEYQSIGADALLVFPIPAYLSPPLDPNVPLRYHEAIAAVGSPIILFQLQPALGGVLYEADVLSRLCQIDEVVAIKEASFDALRYNQVITTLKSLERHIAVLTGNDNFIYESLLLGADAALIGFGAIMVREQVELIALARSKRWEEALPLAIRVQRLADVVFAAPVANYRARLKEALVMLGRLERATVREPLLPISDRERLDLRTALVEVGLLKPTLASS
jgi:4-hydroxy-tetrahydrodipicolinate synthase